MAKGLPLTTAAGLLTSGFLFIRDLSSPSFQLQMLLKPFWIHFPHPAIGFSVGHGCHLLLCHGLGLYLTNPHHGIASQRLAKLSHPKHSDNQTTPPAAPIGAPPLGQADYTAATR